MRLVQRGRSTTLRHYEALRICLNPLWLLLAICEMWFVFREGCLPFELLDESLSLPLCLQRMAVSVIFVKLAHPRHDQLFHETALQLLLRFLLWWAPVYRRTDSDP